MRWQPLKAMQSWLNLEPGEFRPTGLCFAISFGWGFSQTFNWTASSTLFLQYYDSNDMPLIRIASAVLIPLSGLLFMQLGRWLRFPSRFLLFAGLFVLSPVIFRFLLVHEGWRWASMGFAVWYYMEMVFATLLLDGLVNRMFNLRQARRVFGPIATGSDIAGVPAGVLLALIVKQAGVENLLLVSAGVNLLVVVLFVYVARSYRARLEPAAAPANDEEDGGLAPAVGILSLFRNPLVLCILALGALAEFSLEFINNAFYNRTEAFLSQPEQMAAFLGQFFAIASILSSVVQMLASSRLMTLLGIRGCLILGPVLVGFMLLTFAGSSMFGMASAVVFACVAGAKFLQFTVMVNLNDVTQFTLIRSLQPEMRDRVLALSGTVMSPLIGGLSALVLLGMIHFLNAAAAGIAMVAVFVLAARIFVGLKTADEYRANLYHILNDRVITGVELPVNDPDTSRALLALIRDPDPQMALCSLELLGRQPGAATRPTLAEALRHPDGTVRRQAAMLVARDATTGDLPILSDALEAERDATTIAELLPALGRAGGAACRVRLEPWLHHQDPRIVAGACLALATSCGEPGMQAATEPVTRMAGSSEKELRMLAARTLARIGPSRLDGLLIPLLGDPETAVRVEAIEAAARLRHAGLGAAVLANLENPELRPAVVRTLIEGPSTLLDSIEELYRKPGQTPAMQLAIVHIYGRIRNEAGIDLLKQKLGEPRRQIQREILMALANSQYRARDRDVKIIESLLAQCGSCATWLTSCIVKLRAHEHADLLHGALNYELHKTRDMVFLLFSFLYPVESLRFIRFAYFHSRSEDKIAAAVELLDNLLRTEHRKALLPVLEESAPEQRLEKLQKIYPLPDGDIVLRLQEIVNRRYGCDSQWLQAVTLDFIAHSGTLREAVNVPADDPLLQAAGEWLKPPEVMWQGKAASGLSVIERVAALKRAGIFSEVPEEILSEYAPEVIETRYPPATPILRQGDQGSTLCVIVQGRVRIFKGTDDIAQLQAGEIFGELAALDPEPRSADVDSVTEARLLEITAATVEQMIAERGEAGEGIIRELCRRIQTTIRGGIYEETGKWTVASVSEDITRTSAALEGVEKLILLKTIGIFKSVPDSALLHLATLAREYRLDSGATLFRKGDFGTSMYVIVGGEVVVHDEGNIIATLRRGEIIGELALLTSEVRSSTVVANRPTRLLKITQSAFGELLWDHRGVTRSLIQVLTRRLRKMT